MGDLDGGLSMEKGKQQRISPENVASEGRFEREKREVIEYLAQENILRTLNLMCGMLSSQSKQQGAESNDEYIQQ